MKPTKTYDLILDLNTNKFELCPTYLVTFSDNVGNLYYFKDVHKQPELFNMDVKHFFKDNKLSIIVEEDKEFEGFKKIIAYLKHGRKIGIFYRILLFIEYLRAA